MRRAVLCLLMLGCVMPCGAMAETETLEQAWSEAYRINPSLQSERAKLRSTDEAVAQAQSHWRPSIDATANIGKTYQYLPAQKQVGLDPNFSDTSRSYGVQVSQPLFRGFRTDSETEAAENQVHSGRAKLDDAEQQLFVDTATAYLDLIRDQAVLESNRENEHVLEQKLKETGVRAHYGELTQTDVRQAESRLARAHVARYQAETSLTADQASYARLVGHMPEQLASVDLHLAESKELDDLLHLAETRNPKVIAARYDIDEAKAEVDLNKGSLLPEINLVGSRTQNWGQSITVPGHQDSSQILVQATMPLYRAGTDYSKTRQAEQTVTARRMDLEEARHKARETAHNAFQTFQSAESAVEADKDEVKAAAEALAGVREESKVGTRTTLDVLNAEQELLDAKIDLAKSLHDRNLAIVQIKAAIGILTVAALQLSVPAYDPEQHYHDVRNQWIGFSRDDDHYQVPPADEEASR
ncbi:TolC family outer membrane protein [Bradyrhizobium sp. BR13661]|jgi:outer membrane protein|uniref:TolC family outer membrane protein n=1 Tax=Bradyrhizobium sp. BR13661 TaxID=2940622 RepID=UPI0024752008|nr:TolC family outer membrane protein [Bradyrhizobium sp. BR13661]MDH6264384.1 outer membrane protein [Bradyrhizobium sp. BR13661]